MKFRVVGLLLAALVMSTAALAQEPAPRDLREEYRFGDTFVLDPHESPIPLWRVVNMGRNQHAVPYPWCERFIEQKGLGGRMGAWDCVMQVTRLAANHKDLAVYEMERFWETRPNWFSYAVPSFANERGEILERLDSGRSESSFIVSELIDEVADRMSARLDAFGKRLNSLEESDKRKNTLIDTNSARLREHAQQFHDLESSFGDRVERIEQRLDSLLREPPSQGVSEPVREMTVPDTDTSAWGFDWDAFWAGVVEWWYEWGQYLFIMILAFMGILVIIGVLVRGVKGITSWFSDRRTKKVSGTPASSDEEWKKGIEQKVESLDKKLDAKFEELKTHFSKDAAA